MTEPLPRSVLQDRVMAKVVFEGDCWVFTGAKRTNGYGVIRDKRLGVQYGAHAVFWDTSGRLYNKCGNKSCVNWDHWTEEAQSPRVRTPRTRVTECRLCERALRPIGRTVEEFPGTISHVGKGLCSSCKTTTMPKLDVTLRRVVQERFPKDVWTYFGVEE